MKSYHFDIGNSTTGPIGLCARITANSEREAVKILRDRLPDELPIDHPLAFDGEYVRVYFNGRAVTEKDIDEVNHE